ncbi:MAG: protein translocase subunit SecDF [Bacteroidetes bacterium]|nr:MAG: protein translocase subunit SecDF [Bacteroidota bacterium]
MRNKGVIKIFAVLFALVCIYHLSFTWVTNSIQKDAEEFANGDLVKQNQYLDSISGKTVYNFLGIRKFSYKECKERELNLGLDLKGGMNVTLEISVVDVVKEMSNNSKDTTFINAIKLAQKRMRNSQKDFVTLFGEAFVEIDPNGKLAAIFNTVDLKERGISYNSTNEEVLSVIRKETNDAIDNSYNILRSRIDRFGVSQPNIQRLENTGRVLVELPGIKDPERVRKLLQGTASLEFWETYDNKEVYQYLLAANNKLKEIQTAEETLKKEAEASENNKKDIVKEKKETIEVDSTKEKESSLIDQIEGDSLATDSSSAFQAEQMAKNYPLFSVLTPRTNRKGELLSGASIGYANKKDTAKVNSYLRMKQIRSLFPRNIKFLWGVKSIDKDENFYELIAIKITSRDGNSALSGDVVTNARAEFGQNKANAEVSMSMNGKGAKDWARITKNNIGRQIAIVLDNYVYSYPVVNQEIRGGRSSISGNFTIAEAKDLANILKSGKLPAPAKIIQEAIVGPSLGHEAIQKGLWSFAIAFVLVLAFMLFYYNRAGVAANIALLANVFFIIGVLSSLGAVLTLPGIAGIVLTIGMSVDANVLIYDRIKEELRAGKGLQLAISDGYKGAYSAIIDSNVTTFLIALVLGYFGKGPIHGFAVTLGIGIVTSLFSAIFITRLIFEWFLNRKWKINFSIKLTDNAFNNTHINFIGKRKIFYVISSIIILIGIASLFTRGLNKGVDFTGGRTYIVRFENPVNTVDIQKQLAEVYGEAPEVKTFGESNQVKITTKYLIDANELNAEEIIETKKISGVSEPDIDDVVEAKLFEGLKSQFKDNVTFKQFIENYRMSSEKVGPTIADDIKTSALYSILFSLIAIFIYILIRFNNWQYGLGAVLALVHDVAIILGVFSIAYSILPFSLEIDQSFIAAILTVIGYSINDTVVVFDRVREFNTLHRKSKRIDVMNNALNSTLSRTVITSITTFIVLLSVFIFGGETIRGFVFAMLIGVVVGTYSSLFIASPIVYDTIKIVGSTKKIKKRR